MDGTVAEGSGASPKKTKISNNNPLLFKYICSTSKTKRILVTGYKVPKCQELIYALLNDTYTIKMFQDVVFGTKEVVFPETLNKFYQKNTIQYCFSDTMTETTRSLDFDLHFNNSRVDKGLIYIINCPFCEKLLKNKKTFASLFIELISGAFNPSIEEKCSENSDTQSRKYFINKIQEIFFSTNTNMHEARSFFFDALSKISSSVSMKMNDIVQSDINTEDEESSDDETKNKVNLKMNKNFNIKSPTKDNNKNNQVPKILILINHFESAEVLKKEDQKVLYSDSIYNELHDIIKCPWLDGKNLSIGVVKEADYKKPSSTIDNIFFNFFSLSTKESDIMYTSKSFNNDNSTIHYVHTMLQTGFGLDKFVQAFQKIVIKD